MITTLPIKTDSWGSLSGAECFVHLKPTHQVKDCFVIFNDVIQALKWLYNTAAITASGDNAGNTTDKICEMLSGKISGGSSEAGFAEDEHIARIDMMKVLCTMPRHERHILATLAIDGERAARGVTGRSIRRQAHLWPKPYAEEVKAIRGRTGGYAYGHAVANALSGVVAKFEKKMFNAAYLTDMHYQTFSKDEDCQIRPVRRKSVRAYANT